MSKKIKCRPEGVAKVSPVRVRVLKSPFRGKAELRSLLLLRARAVPV